jgi:DUF971 family protein
VSAISAKPWPVELRIDRAAKKLAVQFDSGAVFDLSAEYLRVSSPSAEVQGHGPSTRNLPGGKKNVGLLRAEPVGNYAVRLIFDDQHSSGLFSWDYLYQLGVEFDTRWTAYIDELAAKGLSRE